MLLRHIHPTNPGGQPWSIVMSIFNRGNIERASAGNFAKRARWISSPFSPRRGGATPGRGLERAEHPHGSLLPRPPALAAGNGHGADARDRPAAVDAGAALLG